MEPINFVSTESSQKAKEMEKSLAELPDIAGMIFISVSPIPTPNGNCNKFYVRIGADRDRVQPQTVLAVVKKFFEKEIQSGLVIQAEVYAGVSGRAAH